MVWSNCFQTKQRLHNTECNTQLTDQTNNMIHKPFFPSLFPVIVMEQP